MSSIWAWLFLLTAGIGAWVAYDQVAALEKLALLTSGLLLVYLIDRLGRINAERTLVWGGISCAVLAAGLGALALLPEDKNSIANQGTIATGLIVLLPLGSGSALWLWQRRFRLAAVAVGLTGVWALAMLVVTGERSAWAALAVTAFSGWVIGQRFARARRGRRVWPLDLLGIGATAALLAIYTLALIVPDFHSSLPLGNRRTVIEHIEVWRDALVLIQDYPFTGSGLNATTMVYSTYALPLHVPLYMHMHNLFLQIAVQQGIAGALAFLGMAAASFYALMASWRKGNRAEDGLRSAAMIALAAMLCHGLLDSELFASWLLPLLFLPFAFVLVAARLDQYVIDDLRFGRARQGKRLVTRALLAVVGLLIALVLALIPAVQAALQANLGAVAQTQSELSVYSWPQWPVQDEVRRSDTVSLEPAIAYYQAALRLHPTNSTALRRLGQIALSRGDYAAAQRDLEQAYAQTPQQRIVQLLLGEALAANGHVEQSAAMWNSIAIAVDSFWYKHRQWWYMHIGAIQQAEWIEKAAKQASWL